MFTATFVKFNPQAKSNPILLIHDRSVSESSGLSEIAYIRAENYAFN